MWTESLGVLKTPGLLLRWNFLIFIRRRPGKREIRWLPFSRAIP